MTSLFLSSQRGRGIAFAVLSLALLVLAGCNRPPPAGADKSSTPPASAAKIAAAAATAAAAASAPTLLLSDVDLRTVTPGLLVSGPVITGALQPEKRAELRAELAAVVMQVLKDNGEPVQSGELLVRLDDTALRESLASAEEAVRASTQALEQAERSATRLRTLQAQGMASVQALEDAEQRRVVSNSELVANRARVASARQQLRRSEVRAPFAGVLSERKVSVGDTAAIGKELVKVIDPRSMRFDGQVSADRMQEIKPGQTVNFRVNGHTSGQTPDSFIGKVKRVDPTANASTRQVEVQVDFVDPGTAPRVAGLFAEGVVETGGTSVLMLPEASLVRAGEAVFVWKVSAQNINRWPVKLGPRDARSGAWPVLEGLKAGDRVLRNPGSNLRDGQRVEFARASVPAAAPAVAPTPAAAASR